MPVAGGLEDRVTTGKARHGRAGVLRFSYTSECHIYTSFIIGGGYSSVNTLLKEAIGMTH